MFQFTQNESISDIDRFNYFKKYLSGPTLGTVSALALKRGRNYFDRKVWQSSSINLDTYGFVVENKKVKNMENLNGLPKLYADVENCVRNLKHPLLAAFLFPF